MHSPAGDSGVPGSDVAGMKTRAVRDGDDWILNGSKMFITNGVHGDLVFSAAKTEAEAKGSRGITMFIVEKDTPGFSVGRALNKMGWFSSDTAELVFDNCRVSAENVLGEVNQGFYAIMKNFQNERTVLGAQAVGEASKAIELTLEYVKARKAFGGVLWATGNTLSVPVINYIGLSLGLALVADNRSFEAAPFLEAAYAQREWLTAAPPRVRVGVPSELVGGLQLHGRFSQASRIAEELAAGDRERGALMYGIASFSAEVAGEGPRALRLHELNGEPPLLLEEAMGADSPALSELRRAS